MNRLLRGHTLTSCVFLCNASHDRRVIAANVRKRILSSTIVDSKDKGRAGAGAATAEAKLAAFKNTIVAQLFRSSSSHLQPADMRAVLSKIGVDLSLGVRDSGPAVVRCADVFGRSCCLLLGLLVCATSSGR